jgi:hypothetical protein
MNDNIKALTNVGKITPTKALKLPLFNILKSSTFKPALLHITIVVQGGPQNRAKTKEGTIIIVCRYSVKGGSKL